MVRLTFPAQPKSLLRGAQHLIVVGRAGRLREGLTSVLPAPVSEAIRELLAEQEGNGLTSSTLVEGELRRVTVGVISGAGSRHNCPARPDLVARIVSGSGLRPGAKVAALFCLEEEDHAEATLTGLARGLPLFDRKTSGEGSETKLQILLLDPDGEPVRLSADEKTRVNLVREAAMMVDTPPSELHPEAFAAEAKRLLEEIERVTVKEIIGPALARNKLGGIHAVGKGANRAPRMLVATYRPARPRGEHVALVGKGVTFDTGGLHLKPRGGMEGMKCDMGGAAATLGAFRAIASGGVPRQVSLLLCLAENAIGPDSYKPDDIITMHSGRTVEINNTDAEGRLLLADGLSYAATRLGAEVLIDAATLTGAQLVATGANHAAVVSNDAELEAQFVAAGRASGDLVFPLPFAPEFYQSEFKSPVADMRNSVKNRANAQSSCAAQFLWSHIDRADVRWAHIDLAGPAWQGERGTGFGVSVIAHAVRALA